MANLTATYRLGEEKRKLKWIYDFAKIGRNESERFYMEHLHNPNLTYTNFTERIAEQHHLTSDRTFLNGFFNSHVHVNEDGHYNSVTYDRQTIERTRIHI